MSARLKTRYAALMRTLHAEIKTSPGGFAALAETMGRNAQVMINHFNPNNLDAAPTLEVFVQAIETVGAAGAVNALAGLVGMAAVPVVADGESPTSAVQAFLRVSKELGDVLQEGAADLQDDARFDAVERVRMIRELDEGIAAMVHLRAFLLGA